MHKNDYIYIYIYIYIMDAYLRAGFDIWSIFRGV